MGKLPDVYKLNTYELPRRAGEMKEYELDIEIPEKVGLEFIAVPAGDVIEVDARLESVTEGVLLSAQIFATAKGECGRCLDPIEIIIEKRIQELYLYEKKLERKKYLAPEEELGMEEELVMEGDVMDLEGPIRDLIVLALPSTPLCSDDCEGLCPECGVKYSELPATHAHEQIDARWAGLAALALDEPDFKN